MSSDILNIRCGNCNRRHSSVQAVRDCHAITPAQVRKPQKMRHLHAVPSSGTGAVGQVQQLPEQNMLRPNFPPITGPLRTATDRQLDFIRDLGGDVTYAAKLSMREASVYIDSLKKLNPPKQERTVTDQTKIPLKLLESVPDGYYAVQRDDSIPTGFYRISRPKTGTYQGAIKIQSQHGPNWVVDMTVRGETVRIYDRRSQEDLLMLVVDPNGCTMEYAKKIGKCGRCNTALTDERSRYYGIGPECEKHWPHIIQLVDDRRGPFRA